MFSLGSPDLLYFNYPQRQDHKLSVQLLKKEKKKKSRLHPHE